MTHRTVLLALLATSVSSSQVLAELLKKADKKTVRVVLVGDSTVADGSGWGPALAPLFGTGVEVVNLAKSGRSSKSYRAEGHWKKVLEAKPDFVLIQFGHNDQPGKGPERETDPKTTFRDNLAGDIEEVRKAGATPVLVTPLTRRLFGDDGKIRPSLSEYAEAVQAVAKEQKVELVDLHARSIEELNELGPEVAKAYDPVTKGPTKPDRTHLSTKGAAATAKLVADELKKRVPTLAKHLK